MSKRPPDSPTRTRKPVAPRTQRKAARPVLGWKEEVSIPTLAGLRLLAKLDSGARTSALHAVDIRYERRQRRDWVRFDLPDVDQRRRHRFLLPLAAQRTVKSSIGDRQLRPVVELELCIAGQTWLTEVTLTDRSDMGIPMLIGRRALGGRFLIDPGRTRLAERLR